MPTHPVRALRAAALGLAAVGALLLTAAAPPPDDAPELDQVIDPNQQQGTGQVVVDRGHVDFGPTLNTGEWRIQIHDDTRVPSYWRDPSDVAIAVTDASQLTVPDDPAYAFLGQPAGTDVWVIPQTQDPEVIWTGWNTQEPGVLDSLALGTTLTIHGMQGPGDVVVYLQSGNFGEPDPLWSSLEPFPQQSWIEVNTHTHANWIFSEPGVYLVEVEFSADLVDGSSVSATDVLRFAVGDATPAEEALAAEYQTAEREPAVEQPAAEPQTEDAGDQTATVVTVVAVVVGLGILIAIVVIIVAGRRARARAIAAREEQR